METKVTKIDERGEQTTFFYENELGSVENLVNCVMMYEMNIKNWRSDIYKRKAEEVKSAITKSEHFHIWCSNTKNVAYGTRIL